MKVKDFLRLMIKLFGLYSVVISLFNILPTNIAFLFAGGDGDFSWLPYFWILLVVILILVLFFALTFRPDFLIEKLKLDKGFDSDEINLQNLNAKSILSVGIIIIGGLMVVQSLPSFLSTAYYAIKSVVATSEDVRMEYSLDSYDHIQLITSFLNILLGYLLLSNYQFVTRILIPKDEQ